MEALAEVLNQVRSVSGMGYFHLPRPPNSSGVNKVKQEFDIEIELREHLEKDPAPEWRWHIPNYGTTNWLQITHWNNEYDT
nr:hypothetical protein [Halogranum amylolyticum]